MSFVDPTMPAGLTGVLLADRYRVGARLGSGGMGDVYEAIDETLGGTVAVKVLHATLGPNGDELTRFRREARMAASLGHANIVQVTDFQHRTGEPPFLVMERLRGESLSAILAREETLSPERAKYIFAQVLDALTAAHEAGIIHRDIKAANIFVISTSTMRDLVKVLDFGVAKLERPGAEGSVLTRTGAVIGSPSFMSPEQARGRAIDARSDLFSVGACLYRALAGSDPFVGENLNALMFAIAEEQPASLAIVRSDLDPALVRAVERAMAKDPGLRFPSAVAMREALAPSTTSSKAAPVDEPPISSAITSDATPNAVQRERAEERPAARRSRASRAFVALAATGLAALVTTGIVAATRSTTIAASVAGPHPPSDIAALPAQSANRDTHPVVGSASAPLVVATPPLVTSGHPVASAVPVASAAPVVKPASVRLGRVVALHYSDKPYRLEQEAQIASLLSARRSDVLPSSERRCRGPSSSAGRCAWKGTGESTP